MSEEAAEVRSEDAFDVDAVAAWLREHTTDQSGLAGTPEVLQFPGGASNLTYLLRYPGRDLILRRPPSGAKAKSAHDMSREFTIQSALAPVFGYVPDMVAFCDDPDVIGSDFYVMQRLEGIILRRDLPDGVTVSEPEAEQLCRTFVDVLVELHNVDPGATGLDGIGKGTGYVARQVSGWSNRFRKARTDNVGDYERVMSWLDEHQPGDVATCVIHNDFRLDNVVLAPDGSVPDSSVPDSSAPASSVPASSVPASSVPASSVPASSVPTSDGALTVVGVLDWEMATLGDPLMDLSGALAYWIQADDDEFFAGFRRQPSHLPGMMTRAEMVDYYTSRMGLSVSAREWTFYEVFGLFRLAVIAQQIYYRYHHGQTTNEAYAGFLDVAQYLEGRCERLISGAT